VAADNGHSEVVSLLLAGGANIEGTTEVRREIALRVECCIEAENG